MSEKHYFGIDIGGTYIKYGVVDKAGTILKSDSVETPENLTALVTKIEEILSNNHPENLYGVGVSSPGKIDIEEGVIHHGGSLTFLNGLALEKHINETFNLPCALINDAKSATMAEQWVGNLANVTNGMVLTLGTGLGGGLILNNELYSGTNFQAGELSWTFRTRENINGADMLGSKLSAVKFVQKCAKELNLSNVNDGLTVFKHIETGDNAKVKGYFQEFAGEIALLILNLQSILDLEKFLIGGGVSRQEILLAEINKQYISLRQEFPLFARSFVPVKVEACRYHNDANILGAVYQLLVKLDHL